METSFVGLELLSELIREVSFNAAKVFPVFDHHKVCRFTPFFFFSFSLFLY
jgi:hypothetical protein